MGKIAQTAICSFNDCLRSVSAKGLCKPHYEQRRRGNQLKPLLETLSTTCVMDGCERTVHVKTRQLCRYHYQRLIRGYGELLPRPCEVCETEFVPRRNRNARLCSNGCAITSSRWMREYGLTGIEVNAMLHRQDFKCAICTDGIDRGSFQIDHDHNTGEVRELLCGSCNRGIGHFRDDPKLTQAATAYLLQHRPIHLLS